MVITTAAPKDKEYISTMKGRRSDTK